MGKSVTHVNLVIPEAKRAIELFSIGNDLRACSDYCLLWLGLQNGKINRIGVVDLAEVSAIAIFTKYGRALKGDLRIKTRDDLLAQMSSEDRKTHDLVMAIRDKHVVHSENGMERSRISVWLSTGEDERQITSVSVAGHYQPPGERTIIHNLAVLAGRLYDWTNEELKKECARLRPLIESRYTLEDLYSMIGQIEPFQVTFSDLGKKRKHP